MPARTGSLERVRLFAEAYLANGGKPSAAAKTIGVRGTPRYIAKEANRLLRRARESGLLEQRLQRIERAMGADEAIERLSAVARGETEEQRKLEVLSEIVDLSQYVRQTEMRDAEGGSRGGCSSASTLRPCRRTGTVT